MNNGINTRLLSASFSMERKSSASTVHELVVLERTTGCLIPLPESRLISPLSVHTLLMVKSFTAVLTTGGNQLSADFFFTCFWQRRHTGERYHGNSLINCCGWGVVTSAAVNYCRTQRSNGRFRTIPRFTESWKRGMMGMVCLNVRLSGSDVMPGYRRSPYCSSMRGFMSTALCIPNEGDPPLPVAMCSSIFPWRFGLDMTLWQKMSTKLDQRLQV